MNQSIQAPALNWGALLRAAIAPALVWAVASLVITFAGQPGVFCVTPMAWLLALAAGTIYGQRESLARPAILGGMLAGAILGVVMAALFAFGSNRMMMAETRASELARANTLVIGMGIASVVICAALSGLMAHVTQRRLRRATAQ